MEQIQGDLAERSSVITIWLVNKIADKLGYTSEDIDINENLAEFGIPSKEILAITTHIQKWLKIDTLSPNLFWYYPTICKLSEKLATLSLEPSDITQRENNINIEPDIKMMPLTDEFIHGELKLQEEMSLSNCIPASDVKKNILLTGVTGFLGAYILRDLLELTNASIFCHVRAQNPEDAFNRIKENLIQYDIWNDFFRSRIVPVIGDLSKTKLGFGDKLYDDLLDSIDTVYHNGAVVDFVYTYSRLKQVNINGTQEIILFCSRKKLKPLHFVSSFSVLTGSNYIKMECVPEDEPLNYYPDSPLGYVQSKWVSEKIVLMARDRGLPVAIYRPGFITGDTANGKTKVDDFIPRLIKGCIQMKSFVEVENSPVDMSPVDYVSRALVHISTQKESLGKAFNLINPNPIQWNTLMRKIEEFDFFLEKISYENWLERLYNTSSDNALHFLIPLFRSLPFSSMTQMPKLDVSNVLNAVKGTDISCQDGDTLFPVYFKYYLESGFITTQN